MDFKQFKKIILVVLGVIIILQGILLITGNTNMFPVVLGLNLFNYLFILFWTVFIFNIGAVVGFKFIKE